jgi:hypothetical protein
MGETSRGPPGRDAKRCPAGEKQGSISQNQSSVYGATNALEDGRRQEKLFDSPNPVTDLKRLRAVHARLTRIIRHLRAINDQLGGRAKVEITIRLAELTEALKALDELAARWRTSVARCSASYRSNCPAAPPERLAADDRQIRSLDRDACRQATRPRRQTARRCQRQADFSTNSSNFATAPRRTDSARWASLSFVPPTRLFKEKKNESEEGAV